MTDWTRPMGQTFEFYLVDADSWQNVRMLETVVSASLTWDSTVPTLGNASFEIDEDLGEAYVRCYLVAKQGGEVERVCLGTYLLQTPRNSFDGMVSTISVDAYTPLLEMADNYPPVGYHVGRNTKRQRFAESAVAMSARAPFVTDDEDARGTVGSDFVAEVGESWLDYANALMANGGGRMWLTANGDICVRCDYDAASMQPVWTFTDDERSIMLPDADRNRDLYGVPNRVEVVYTGKNGTATAVATNDDPSSAVSTVTRGRTVTYRETNPSFDSVPTAAQARDYAQSLLRELSCLETSLTIRHGYCPVRLGDCVRVNYTRAGIDVLGVVTSQVIECDTGCTVETTITYMEVV